MQNVTCHISSQGKVTNDMAQKVDLVGRPRNAEMFNGDRSSKLIDLQTLLIYMQNCHCGVEMRRQKVGGHVSRLESEDLRLEGGDYVRAGIM
jgi:hypothetical protein